MSDLALQRVAFVWDNFGPLHDDRLRACSTLLKNEAYIIGVEINGKSDVYSWVNDRRGNVSKYTLYPNKSLSDTSDSNLFVAVLRVILSTKADVVFLCHYERAGTVVLSFVLRLLGRRVFVMGCSKFDDRPRTAWREMLKQIVMTPYQGALVGSQPTREFLEFLGLRGKPFALGYNTVSNDRIVGLAKPRKVTSFEDKAFVVIARLVPKKNIATIIRAFASYRMLYPDSRRCLNICGDGPLETELRDLAVNLGISEYVVFHGFLQSEDVVPILAGAVALLLISTEEQFGNVVPEALALGVPVILSDVCGARYELLRSGYNGWLVEADNVHGIIAAMRATSENEATWYRMSEAALAMAPRGDVARFAAGVEALLMHGRDR